MSSGREVTAGMSISLTGSFSLQGRQASDGILLWQSYVNSQGGIDLGTAGRRQIRVIVYDDQSRVGSARSNAQRLLDIDSVDILFGPYSSVLTLAVAEVAVARKKILWNHGGSSDEIFKRGHAYPVSTASPASEYLGGLPGLLARKSPRLRRIGLLQATKGTFAAQVARGFVEATGLLGLQAVEVIPVTSPVRDAGPFVRKLRATCPDVLVLAGSFWDEVRIMQKRAEWPASVREVAAVAAGVSEFYAQLNEEAEDVIGPSQWEPEVTFEEKVGPDSSWFVENFQERFGRVPEYTAAGGFAIGLVVAECLRQAGSLEDDRLREVAAGLDFNTFYGRFHIDPATGRQIGHRIVLVQWHEGCKVVVGDGNR